MRSGSYADECTEMAPKVQQMWRLMTIGKEKHPIYGQVRRLLASATLRANTRGARPGMALDLPALLAIGPLMDGIVQKMAENRAQVACIGRNVV